MIMHKEISSLQHPLVKHLVKLRQNRDYREEHHSVVIEGHKLVREVCVSSPAKLIITTDLSLLPPKILSKEILVVNEAILKKISGVSSPEGIMAEVSLPPSASLSRMHRLIAFDGINDPGNLGTLLRTALALGWEGAYLLSNSCDPFNDKALRAAKGATFKLPLAHGTWNDLRLLIKKNKLQPLVADMSGTPVDQFKSSNGIILILGNEANGVSEEARDYEKIKIPMAGEMESLNVAIAGALLMYLLQRRPL